MLPAQVNYWNLVETNRHNLEQEKIGRFNNKVQAYNAVTNRKSQYYNAITSRRSQQETARHNKATESLTRESQYEMSRHNKVQEYQADLSRQLGYYNATISNIQAQAAASRAETDRLKYELEYDVKAADRAVGGWINTASTATGAVGTGVKVLKDILTFAKALADNDN